jgi:hypothetical protein
MKQPPTEIQEFEGDDRETGRAINEIIRAIRSINFGSVEIVIHDSRIVQIERKEKLRLDRR